MGETGRLRRAPEIFIVAQWHGSRKHGGGEESDTAYKNATCTMYVLRCYFFKHHFFTEPVQI